MCFFRRLQRRDTATSFFHTHTLIPTHTHKHMTGQQWLTGQVVPEEFFSGFANFWTPSGQQAFFRPTGGHATYENIILRELIVSFCLYFYAGIMLQGFLLGFNLSCKDSLLEINSMPTAG